MESARILHLKGLKTENNSDLIPTAPRLGPILRLTLSLGLHGDPPESPKQLLM